MILRSLNQILFLRDIATTAKQLWWELRYGVVFGARPKLSSTAAFVSLDRGSIVVGDETLIAFKTLILSFDRASGARAPVRIGSRCFIGGGSIVMPGVTIGDESIVGAGSVVVEDVPERSIVAGIPGRVIRRDIEVGPYARLKGADENSARMWHFD